MPSKDQGILNGRYTLVPRTLVFLTRGEQILLIKGAPHKRLWANLYNGVGGHVERGEDVLTAARREVYEETGLQPETIWLCGIITIDARQESGICIFIFRGESRQGEVHPSTEGSLEWVSMGQLSSLAVVEDLQTILPRVISQSPESPPFSANYQYDENDHLVITFSE
jgi:8-oxo-dGTP diphosphatase